MKPGDKAFYRHTHRGGYGFEVNYPAVVVKVNATTVRIRLGRMETVSGPIAAVERSVAQERLTHRDDDCEFEDVLRLNHAPRVRPERWRGRRATEVVFPFSEGWDSVRGGPRVGEAVVAIGFALQDRFRVAYIRSYAPGEGYARQAYEWLKEQYGALDAIEVVPSGEGFHRRMRETGVIDSYSTDDIADDDADDHRLSV